EWGQKNQPFQGASAFIPAESTDNLHAWSDMTKIGWSNIVSDKTTLQGQFSHWAWYYPESSHPEASYPPAPDSPYARTDLTTQKVTGGFIQPYYQHYWRWQHDVSLNHFTKWLQGSHEVKIGYTGWTHRQTMDYRPMDYSFNEVFYYLNNFT